MQEVFSIKDLMKSPVVTIDQNKNINDVDALFRHSGLSHLVVVDKEEKLQGVISKTDFLSFFKFLSKETTGKTWTEKQSAFYKAKHLMSTCLEIVQLNDSLDKVLSIFTEVHCHCIPVLDGAHLVGIITPFDVVKITYLNNLLGTKQNSLL